MKTLIEARTKGDEMTLPGGIAVRQREHSNGDAEFIVHNFNTDRETETAREYWQGSYCSKLSDAMTEFARRVARAEGYDTGGALDIGKLGIPKDISLTLEAGLERREELFFDNDRAFGDYSEDDKEAFHAEQAAAKRWLADR